MRLIFNSMNCPPQSLEVAIFHISPLWCKCCLFGGCRRMGYVCLCVCVRGGVALITTSLRLWWHFHSCHSHGGLFISRKWFYIVMHYSQRRCLSDLRRHRLSRRQTPSQKPLLAGPVCWSGGRCANRCSGIMSLLMFTLLFAFCLLKQGYTPQTHPDIFIC